MHRYFCSYIHIGIYIGSGLVRDSTKIGNKRDGVGTRSINDFQRVGLAKMLDFERAMEIRDAIFEIKVNI